MPIYEYECRRCGNDFEKLVLSSETDEDVSCPCCGGKDIRRRVSCASTLTGGGKSLCGGSGASRFS